MKLPKRIAALLTVTLVASSSANLGYVNAAEGVSSEVLKGAGRWETAIEVSQKGWSSATEAIIVNDASIVDALAATPFADAKNAPILLTGKDSLNEKTKAELKRLGVKKVYIIGGVNTLTKNVEDLLKAEKLEVDRIHGNTRELTALEIAKRLDEIKPISEIAVVNSTKGLADAVSIAATAADKDMAIILSNTNEGTKASDEFIKSKDIKTSYVIGGVNSVSEEVKNKLPNAKRIYGKDRNETNAEVLKTFYTGEEINNAYIAKDGMGKEDQLIDALAVGVLAAKNDSPVIIVGNKLNEVQKDVTNTKSFKNVTQVGGSGNETAFNELKTMQGVTTYEVKTVAELNDALAKADANDVINVRSLNDNSRNQNTEIKSENTITINIDSTSEKTLSIDIKNGTVKIYENQTVIYMESGELVIKGKISTINVAEGGDVTIVNESTSQPNVNVAEGASVSVDGKINTITVSGKDAEVSVSEGSTVSKVVVNKDASGTVVNNDGKINNVTSNAPNVTVDNNGTVGGTSGTNKPTVDGNPVKPPSTGGGSSSGEVVQNPIVSNVNVNTNGDNVTVTATVKNYGSITAKVELLEGTTVVESEEKINIVNGQVSHTFEKIENGTYTIKVTVGSANASSQTFMLNAWDGTTMTEVTPIDGVYKINTPSELAWIANFVNEGNTNISIKLMAGIDLSNKEWTPIGVYPNQFRGIFDGGNHTIKNLKINRAEGSDLGLFGYANSGTTLKNVILDGVNIVGYQRMGSLVGSIFDEQTSSDREEIIENCHVKNVTINAKKKDAGAIVGYGYVDIKDVTVDNAVVIADPVENEGDNVGGVIGYLASERTVTNATTSNVELKGERKVAGIAGSVSHNKIVFDNCKVNGNSNIDVRNSKATYAFAGGIVGEATSNGITVKDCFVDKDTVKILGENNNLLGWFVGGSGTRDGKPLEEQDINFEDTKGLGCNFDNNELLTFAKKVQIVKNENKESAEIVLNQDSVYEVNSTELATLTGSNTKKLTIKSKDAKNPVTLTFTGRGTDTIKGAGDAEIVFENINIVDNSNPYSGSAWEYSNLEMGGKLSFNNVTFKSGMMLESSDATFTNCKFDESINEGRYAAWVSDGNATFEGCTFNSPRNIKVHEAYGSKVNNVVVNRCVFTGSKKPAVAIGDVSADVLVSITNNDVNTSASTDPTGEAGIYETDTPKENFKLIVSDNY